MADAQHDAGADAQLRARIRRRVVELMDRAAGRYPALRGRQVVPQVAFDLRGQAAGQAVWRAGQPPLLRFNLAIARHYGDDFVNETVAHEVAHVVARHCHPGGRPHGREWRAVMRQFGIREPRRCHDYRDGSEAVRRQRRWLYECSCRMHQLSTTRHRRIQAGLTVYHCRQCRGVLTRATDEP